MHADMKTAEQMALNKLAPRERQVADAIHAGINRKEIAASMGISRGTLQTYLEKIFAKLDVHNAAQLVLVVERAKVVSK